MIAAADRAWHAARNNADHYEAMFAAHGLAWHRDRALFRALSQPLPYHAAALVLEQGDARQGLNAVAKALAPFAGGAAVKDGFATLDLRPLGLEIGFRARWIWADQPPTGGASWEIIACDADLDLWEQAWKSGGSPTAERMFPPACLALGNLVFCGRRSDGGFDAGCIVNRSDGLVGLSNVFGEDAPEDLFGAALAMAAEVGGGCPVAGFERGADLDGALAAGFADAGPLTVWFPRSGD